MNVKKSKKPFDGEIRVRLKAETVAALQGLADKEELTISHIVRKAVRKFLVK